MSTPVEVLICTTCKRPDMDPEATRPGAVLLDQIAAGEVPDGVVVRGVECLSNCDHGCSVVLRGGAQRWTYVYGNLDPETDGAEIVRDGAERYLATRDGLVPWRERSQHFRKNCIARIPPQNPIPSLEAAE